MGDKNKMAVLNIGSQRISLALFQKTKKGGLVLIDYDAKSILVDPNAEHTRMAQVKFAIADLAESFKIKQRVSIAISGQQVFTRFVKVPALDENDIEQLVTYEAAQHIPFPLEEVTWDWQDLGDHNGEREVVIVAVKTDVLEDIQFSMSDADFKTRDVDASPIALYNSFRLNYPDFDESAMMIDIGAKTSNIIYIDGPRVYARAIAIGGARVTSAIAQEYNVSFEDAEKQKCRNGQVALDPHHTSQLDDLTAALATVIRTSLNRMPAEIGRTTNYYRSQYGGRAPRRVFLAGGGSNLPNIAEFLQEKLKLPVEHFNALRVVAVSKNADMEQVGADTHQMGELVGLATRQIGKTPLSIDLVPEVVELQRQFEKKKPKLILGAVGLVVGMLILFLFGATRNAKASRELDELIAKEKELKAFSAPIKKLEKQEASLNALMIKYAELQENRVIWLDTINELSKAYTDQRYWITELEPLVNHTVPLESTAKASKSKKRSPKPKETKTYFQGEGETKVAKVLKPTSSGKLFINAIQVKGIWMHAASPSVISKKTRDKKSNSGLLIEGKFFSDTLKMLVNKQVSEQVLVDKQIRINMSTKPDEGSSGGKFTMILPLTNPIEIK